MRRSIEGNLKGYVTTYVTKASLKPLRYLQVFDGIGRGDWIRTTDLLVPN